jgi:predicted O-methyltransferase YrrM
MNLAKAASVIPLIARLKTMHQSDPDTLVDFALSHRVIKPLQVRSEFRRFAGIVATLTPRFALEIGTFFGGTLFVISRLADPAATIISVDMPGGKFGGGYQSFRAPIYRCFPTKNQRLHLIRGNSHDSETQGKVRDILGGQELDLLFIDGDHTYGGVKADFDQYRPMVRKGGTIVFHDIAVHPPEVHCEVADFWNEIKQQYSHEEIIEDRNQGHAGIGVLTV